jgi:hypothetical protein
MENKENGGIRPAEYEYNGKKIPRYGADAPAGDSYNILLCALIMRFLRVQLLCMGTMQMCVMNVKILFTRGKSTANMSFALIQLKYLARLPCKLGIDCRKPLGDILMYGRDD